MAKSFKCPSCGAPLDYEGGEKLTVQCPFCSNVVIVPEELRPAKNPPPAASAPVASTGPVPTDPREIKARIKANRHAAREERKELRHHLRKIRRGG